MVEKFQKILEEIENENGKVFVFALLKMDELIDRWTIILSASWATVEKRGEAFKIIRDKIIATLTPQEIGEIARIAIYPKTEHLIEELSQYKTGATIENKPINGNTVHYAHIIKSEEKENLVDKVS